MKYVIKSVAMVLVSALTAVILVSFAPVVEVETITEIPVTQTVELNLENGCEKFTDVEALVGYLNVPNTTIDDAVVQAKDNNYFLRKDKYGKYSYSGSYFADYKCDMNNLSKSTIIYGHNLMDETRYFGQLMKYKSLDFYKSTPVITFDIKQKACRWKVFSVFYANTVKTDSDYFYYLNANFGSDDEFMEFVNQVQFRSLINTTVDVNKNDKVLFLSTCNYDINKYCRFVVAARLVRDGETLDVDVENAQLNPCPLYPDPWYKKYGGTKPQLPEITVGTKNN